MPLNKELTSLLDDCLTKAKELGLPYYLPIARARRNVIMPFPRALVQNERQTTLSRI